MSQKKGYVPSVKQQAQRDHYLLLGGTARLVGLLHYLMGRAHTEQDPIYYQLLRQTEEYAKMANDQLRGGK